MAGKNPQRGLGRPFQPGQSGNPAGRPKGSRHKATLAAQVLLDGEAEAITRKAIEQAKAGDTTALRLCLERIAPPRRDQPAPFDLGPVEGSEDALRAHSRVLQAMADGELTSAEAQGYLAALEQYRRAFETVELERRLRALEERES